MQNLKKRIAFILIATLIMSLWPMTVLADPAVGPNHVVSDENDLEIALANLSSGDTIELTDNIIYTIPSGISIDGKSITFNLGDYDLDIINNSSALWVTGGGEILLTGTGGELNVTVTGDYLQGIHVENGSSATVTNVEAIGVGCYGVYATIGSSITVTNNTSAVGYESIAAYADLGGNISIGGKVMSDGERCSGAKVWDGAITIEGNVEASGKFCQGINVSDGDITVKGDVTATGEACQGAVCSTSSSTADIKGSITVSGLGCYGTYSNTLGSSFLVGGNINAYGENSRGAYAMFGGTITVGGSALTDGNYSYAVYAQGSDNIIQVGQNAVASGSGVYGVYVDFGSTVKVDQSVLTEGTGQSYGVYEYGGTTAIGGDIVGNGDGIICAYADNGGTLTVSGSAISEGQNSRGAYAKNAGSVIIIGQDITTTGEYCRGALASDNGKVTVSGNITAGAIDVTDTGVAGAWAETGGMVTVNGNASAIGSQSQAAFVSDPGSHVTIGQSVMAAGEYCQGVSLIGGSSATVNGNISVNGDYGIGANTDINSRVIVNGNIVANGIDSCGVLADHSSTATAGGIITSSGTNNRGVSADNGSAITVDGSVNASYPIILNGLNIDSTTPLADSNYLIYTKPPKTSTIRIRLPLTPLILTQPLDTIKNETQQALFTVGATVSDGGIIRYQWQKYPNGGSWGNISGATNTSFTTGVLSTVDNGNKYRCRITNEKSGTSAAIFSNSATLTVNPLQTLVSIPTPAAITGLANGSAKTVTALGLPTVVTMVTNGGNVNASVSWDVSASSYDTSSAVAQTFYVTGTAVLPAGVVNTNSVPLTISISVSVLAKTADDTSGKSSSKSGAKASIEAGNSRVDLPINIDRINGSATAELNSAVVNTAFSKTKADSDGVKQITIEIPEIKNVKEYALELPASILSSEEEKKRIGMTSEIGSISLPDDMLNGSGIDDSESVRISLGEGDKSALSRDVQERIGSKPVIELKLTAGGKVVEWNNSEAPVTISIPYVPTAAELENPEHIVIWYIDGKGKLVEVSSGRYDAETGSVQFSTTHFSHYAIAYVTKTFDDLETVAWAKKPIEVLASKGIVEGLSESKYSPRTNISRGEFLCFLIRALNIEANFEGNFDDVGNDMYFYKEIGTAKELGITTGTGKNRFYPDTEISRQDMMVLTERTLTILNKLDKEGTSTSLDQFSDKSKISAYASDSISSIVEEGLIVGNGSKLNPRGNATRAEAAMFLYRIYDKYSRPVK